MKVILLQDIARIGKKGDVLEVAEGHARNYLLPRGLASEASKGKMNDLERQKSKEEEKKFKIKQQSEQLAEKINNLTVKVFARVGENGKLFGAIGNSDIAKALADQHKVDIDKKKIILKDTKDTIKTVGEYKAIIKLHPAVQAEIKVEVLPQ